VKTDGDSSVHSYLLYSGELDTGGHGLSILFQVDNLVEKELT